MKSKIDTRLNLLEIIQQKDEVIEKQNETIAALINENAEKENMINELMRSAVDYSEENAEK